MAPQGFLSRHLSINVWMESVITTRMFTAQIQHSHSDKPFSTNRERKSRMFCTHCPPAPVSDPEREDTEDDLWKEKSKYSIKPQTTQQQWIQTNYISHDIQRVFHKIWNALQITEYKFLEYHSAEAEKLCTENMIQELVTHKSYTTDNFNWHAHINGSATKSSKKFCILEVLWCRIIFTGEWPCTKWTSLTFWMSSALWVKKADVARRRRKLLTKHRGVNLSKMTLLVSAILNLINLH